MRLLVVTHTDGAWGAEQRLVEYLPHLIDSGISPTLLAPAEGDFTSRFRAAGGDVELMDLGSRVGLRSADGGRPGPMALAGELKHVAGAARSLARVAKRFDVVQSHSRTAHVEVALAGRFARKPTVLDHHDVIAEGIGRRAMQLAANLASTTVVNSSSTRESVPGVADSKLVVINPAVDLDRYTGRVERSVELRSELAGGDCDDSTILVGILGRIDVEKRIEVLLRAAEQLDMPQLRIVVVGAALAGDDYLDRLETGDLSSKVGRVEFVGARSDIPEVMACLDVVVSTCPVEAFGRTLLEAQASRVPVIGPDLSGVRDIVRTAETGWLFRPDDVSDLASVLGDLALRLDAAETKMVVERARSQAEGLGVAQQAMAFARVYQDLVV